MTWSKTSQSALGPERLPGESSRAFHAFCVYRDLGPERSLDAAWSTHRVNSDQRAESRGRPRRARRATKCPGPWTAWSSQFHWVERAAAYDEQIDAANRAARLERDRKLEERRSEFEFRNQERLEQRVNKMEAVLDKADAAPITDVTQDKDETAKGIVSHARTKVKGINFSAYAALVKQTNDTARQAIVGVRGTDEEAKYTAPQVEGIVWRRNDEVA